MMESINNIEEQVVPIGQPMQSAVHPFHGLTCSKLQLDILAQYEQDVFSNRRMDEYTYQWSAVYESVYRVNIPGKSFVNTKNELLIDMLEKGLRRFLPLNKCRKSFYRKQTVKEYDELKHILKQFTTNGPESRQRHETAIRSIYDQIFYKFLAHSPCGDPNRHMNSKITIIEWAMKYKWVRVFIYYVLNRIDLGKILLLALEEYDGCDIRFIKEVLNTGFYLYASGRLRLLHRAITHPKCNSLLLKTILSFDRNHADKIKRMNEPISVLLKDILENK